MTFFRLMLDDSPYGFHGNFTDSHLVKKMKLWLRL